MDEIVARIKQYTLRLVPTLTNDDFLDVILESTVNRALAYMNRQQLVQAYEDALASLGSTLGLDSNLGLLPTVPAAFTNELADNLLFNRYLIYVDKSNKVNLIMYPKVKVGTGNPFAESQNYAVFVTEVPQGSELEPNGNEGYLIINQFYGVGNDNYQLVNGSWVAYTPGDEGFEDAQYIKIAKASEVILAQDPFYFFIQSSEIPGFVEYVDPTYGIGTTPVNQTVIPYTIFPLSKALNGVIPLPIPTELEIVLASTVVQSYKTVDALKTNETGALIYITDNGQEQRYSEKVLSFLTSSNDTDVFGGSTALLINYRLPTVIENTSQFQNSNLQNLL